MTNIFASVLKRMYENGLKGANPSVSKADVAIRVMTGKISKSDYEEITGEKYED